MIEEAGEVVKRIPVELAGRDERLHRVSVGRGGRYEVSRQEGERAPRGSRDALHAQDEGVGEHVPRVRERVLLPQLAEEIRHCGHARVVQHEVALEEEMDRSAWRGLGGAWVVLGGGGGTQDEP